MKIHNDDDRHGGRSSEMLLSSALTQRPAERSTLAGGRWTGRPFSPLSPSVAQLVKGASCLDAILRFNLGGEVPLGSWKADRSQRRAVQANRASLLTRLKDAVQTLKRGQNAEGSTSHAVCR